MLQNKRHIALLKLPGSIAVPQSPGKVFSIRPGRAERMALPLFTFIFVLILTIAWLIHYPEVLKARAALLEVNGKYGFSVQIDLPQNNSARLNAEDPIQFSFDAFPSAKYGTVKAVLKYVYNVESPNNITAKIYFPGGLRTSKGMIIPFEAGLKADALIVLKDMRLLQHIFYSRSRAIGQ